MNRSKRLIRIAAFWLGISVVIGAVTFLVCGSFRPILYGYGYPDYSSFQWILFLIAKIYSWPVTIILLGAGEITPFDIFVSPFLLETADLKLGPAVILLYVVFYSALTVLVEKLITRFRS
jgi:hypothetical protein